MDKESASQHHKKYQSTYDEIKELKEKLKGNMSLIHAREIIWNDIVQWVKEIWNHMLVMEEKKIVVRDLEIAIASNKYKSKKSAQLAKRRIGFLNDKSYQELREMEIEDKTFIILEINKMVQKNIYKRNVETKLGEIKESKLTFHSNFDKRTRVGFPSGWGQQGNILPWETYDTLLVEAKSKINASHEKTTILKG